MLLGTLNGKPKGTDVPGRSENGGGENISVFVLAQAFGRPGPIKVKVMTTVCAVAAQDWMLPATVVMLPLLTVDGVSPSVSVWQPPRLTITSSELKPKVPPFSVGSASKDCVMLFQLFESSDAIMSAGCDRGD